MKEFLFDELVVGQEANFLRVLTMSDIEAFTRLSGDFNPLHVDDSYAKNTPMAGLVAHGMLASSLFSTLVGMHMPGKYCLYLSQDIQFRKPVRPDFELVVYGKIINKIEALKIVDIETSIATTSDEVLITGLARVKVLK